MKSSTRSIHQRAIDVAVRRIAEGLDAALDLGALAREACLAPLHFHHVFRGMTGETPLEMHRRLRLERAATVLAATETAITTIAFDAGYETHESFTRAFRRAFDESPSGFRARARGTVAAIHYGEPRRLAPGAPMQISTESFPTLTVLAIRHIGPYHTISVAFSALGEIAQRANLFALPGVMMIATYHDDPEATPAEELRSDAGSVVPAGTPVPDGLVAFEIPAGRFAKTTHAGPYTTIGETWARFMGAAIPSTRHEIRDGVSFEIYRNTPLTTAPAELRTDLYVPIS